MLFGNGKLFLCLLTLVLLFLQTVRFLIHMHYLALLATRTGKQSSFSISLCEMTIVLQHPLLLQPSALSFKEYSFKNRFPEEQRLEEAGPEAEA